MGYKYSCAGIYRIRNVLNNKSYIGSSVDVLKRLNYHFLDLRKNEHGNAKLQRSFNLYGINNFEISILKLCDKSELIKWEQYYIDLYDSCNNGYNLSPKAGNCLGVKHTLEARKNMSLAHIGKKRAPEEIEKFKETMKLRGGVWNKGLKGFMLGRKTTEEAKRKIRLANSGNKNGMYGKTPWNKGIKWDYLSAKRKGKNNPMYGKFGELHPTAKLTWDKVNKMRELRKLDHSYSQLANMFNISISGVAAIITGKLWKTQ